MSQRWEISRVITPKRLELELGNIFFEVRKPGILVFGADPIIEKRDSDIHDTIKEAISRSRMRWNCDPFTHEPFFYTLKVLNGEESCDPTIRDKSVAELYNEGARGIVGIYVKYVKEFRAEEGKRLNEEQRRQIALHNEQVATLLQNPPTPDGFAYLITISKEDE